MNLYPLHRPSPAPAVQQAKVPERESTATTTTSVEEDLRKALARAEAHSTHWELETRKMDRLARDAHDKLDAKKKVRSALKAELETTKESADKWRAQYRELLAAATSKSMTTATGGQEELKTRLRRAEEEVGALRRERAGVEELLRVGGAASRELDLLKPRVKDLESKSKELEGLKPTLESKSKELEGLKSTLEPKIKELAGEVERLKAVLRTGAAKAQVLETETIALRAGAVKARQLEAEVSSRTRQLEAEVSSRTRQLEAEVSSRTRQLELEVLTAKEKLRAATNEVSAGNSKVQACADMLTRAEQVLKTCSQLHAAKGESHALVRALTETTTNIDQFLRAVVETAPPPPGKP